MENQSKINAISRTPQKVQEPLTIFFATAGGKTYNEVKQRQQTKPVYRGGYTLSVRAGSALVRHSKVARSRLTECSKSCDMLPASMCNTWSSGGTALCKGGGVTSQLDLPCLTPLSVAGCDRLQLGAPHLATSVQ